MRLLLGLAFALACVTPALADDWWLFSVTDDVSAFIDMDGIVQQGDMRVIPLRRFDTGQPQRVGDATVWEHAERWELDCAGRRARPTHIALYSNVSVLLVEGDAPPPPRWVEWSPDSNISRLVDVVCSNDRSAIRDLNLSAVSALRAFMRARGNRPVA